MNNPFLEQADLRSQHEALWLELAREQVLMARLEAELAGKSTMEWKDTNINLPVPNSVESKLKSLETEQFALRRTDFEKERAHLKRSLVQENERRELLKEQQKKEQLGTDADNDEFDRVQDLYKRGTVPVPRVSEVRRLTLLSSTHFLQTTAQLAQVEKDREELLRTTSGALRS